MLALLGKIGMFAAKFKFLKDSYDGTNPPTAGDYTTLRAESRFAWINDLWKYMEPVLWAIMAIVAAAGAVYAIVLGVNLAKADDQSKRDEAKKRLITVLISVAITIALVIFFTTLLPYIIAAFSDGQIAVS